MQTQGKNCMNAWTTFRLHLRRTCEPGLYKFWESILQSQILTIKSCMIELQLYAYLTKLSQQTVSTSCAKRLFVGSRSFLLTFSRRIGSLCSDFRLTRDVGCILEKRNMQHRRLYLTDRVDAMVTVWLTWQKKKSKIPKRFLTVQVACYPKQPAVKIRCENISCLPLCIPFFDPALSSDNSLSTKTFFNENPSNTWKEIFIGNILICKVKKSISF